MAGRAGLLRHRQAPDVSAPGDGRTPVACGFAALRSKFKVPAFAALRRGKQGSTFDGSMFNVSSP
jgi:hypothetical protein